MDITYDRIGRKVHRQAARANDMREEQLMVPGIERGHLMSTDAFPSEAVVESLEGRLQNFTRLNRELLVLFERLAAKGDERFLRLLKEFAKQGP